MSKRAICQRCGAARDAWQIDQARLHVGCIVAWTVMLCAECSDLLERAIRAALWNEQKEER